MFFGRFDLSLDCQVGNESNSLSCFYLSYLSDLLHFYPASLNLCVSPDLPIYRFLALPSSPCPPFSFNLCPSFSHCTEAGATYSTPASPPSLALLSTDLWHLWWYTKDQQYQLLIHSNNSFWDVKILASDMVSKKYINDYASFFTRKYVFLVAVGAITRKLY